MTGAELQAILSPITDAHPDSEVLVTAPYDSIGNITGIEYHEPSNCIFITID